MEGSTITNLLLTVPCGLASSLAGMTGSQLVLLVVAVVGLAVVMFSTMRRLRGAQGENQSVTVRELYTRLDPPSVAVRDAEQVMLELDQLSRQLHARLDTKLARLEAVIHDADRRIEALGRVVQSETGRPSLNVMLDEQASIESMPRERPRSDERHVVVYRLADEGRSPAEIARQVGKLQGEVELILALRGVRSGGAAPTSTSDVAALGHDR